MKFHDIVCDADGWLHVVDGVRSATFPSWVMALNAARKAAERDVRKGLIASVRYQSVDGTMLPVQQKVVPNAGLRVLSAESGQEMPAAARLSA